MVNLFFLNSRFFPDRKIVDGQMCNNTELNQQSDFAFISMESKWTEEKKTFIENVISWFSMNATYYKTFASACYSIGWMMEEPVLVIQHKAMRNLHKHSYTRRNSFQFGISMHCIYSVERSNLGDCRIHAFNCLIWILMVGY